MYVVPYDHPVPYYEDQAHTDDEFLKEQLRRDVWAENLGKELDIPSWVAINQLITLPIESWLGRDEWTTKFGLHPLIKRAIALEVEKVVSKINSDRSEAERKMEMEKAELKQRFNYGSPNSSFQRLFQ